MSNMKEKIQKQNELMKRRIQIQDAMNSLYKEMNYADFGAYSQDKHQIAEYQREIAILDQEFSYLNGSAIKPPPYEFKPFVSPVTSSEEAREAREEWEREVTRRTKKYVDRYKNNRTRTSVVKVRYYLVSVPYAIGQTLKAENRDLLWDPKVKRWYFSILDYGSGTKFVPGGKVGLYMETPKNNADLLEKSTKAP